MHGSLPSARTLSFSAFFAALLALLTWSSAASAQTDVSGGITVDTNWTTAGSPYRVTGSVVVQTGSTLTIDPGVVVEVLAVNTEIEVRGALVAVGTEAAPIVFRSDEGTSTGQWEGLRFGSAATTTLQYVQILNADYALEFDAPTAANYSISDTTIRQYASRAVNVVASGTLTIDGIDATTDASTAGTQYGVYMPGGTLIVRDSRFGYGEHGIYTVDTSVTLTRVISDHHTTNGVDFQASTTGTYNLNVTYSTFFGNTDAFRVNRVASSTRVANVSLQTSVFGDNGYIYRDVSSSSSYPVAWSTFRNNVWWGGNFRTGGIAPSTDTGNLQFNGLLADPENGDFEPTDRSPARYYSPSNPTGTLGAVPHAGAPTGDGVHGFWYVNRTFPFNSVTEVAGDMVITSGVTMTFEPDARLEMAARSDVMEGGTSPTRIEIIVEGELQANGTGSRPVVFTSGAATPARGDWYGVYLSSQTEAFSVGQVEIGYATRGVTLDNATNTIVEMEIHHCSEAGLWIVDGSPSVLRTDIHDNQYGIRAMATAIVDIDETDVFDNTVDGIYSDDASFSMNIGRIYGNGQDGIKAYANTTGTYTVTLDRVTVSNNGQDGIELNRVASSTRVLNVSFRSSASTLNGQYGVRDASTSSSYRVAFSCINSNWWGNGSSGSLNYAVVPAGTCESWNPLYVDADARNYAPTRYSPHRGLGYLGGLIGADTYGGALGPLYMGFVWEDQTFTAAAGPYQLLGDLYVPTGVTLTVEPGVEFLVANNADGMGGGLTTSRTELRVLSGGTLLVGDEDGEQAHFRPNTTTPSAGAWYGMRFDDALTSRLENTRIDYPQYGAWMEGPRAPIIIEAEVRFPSTTGFHAQSVTTSPDVDVLASQVIGTGGGTGVNFVDSSGDVRSSYITHTNTGMSAVASTTGTYNVYFINNTVVHQATGITWNRVASSTRVLNIWVENNVVAASTSRALSDTSSSSSYPAADTVRNNNLYGTTSTSGTFTTYTGNITTNPLVEDDDWDSFPRWWDGKLWAESLAINAGVSATHLPSRDITGRARNFSGGIDIGAWEFDPAENREPRADAAVASRMVPWNEQFTLDGSGALDLDGFIASAFWTMSDGTVTPGQTVQHTFTVDGSRWAYLTIIDDDGAEDHAKVDLNVNRRPTADAGPAIFQDVGGELDPFDGTNSDDPDGTLVSYVWDFGDGTGATGAEVLHSYASAGVYLVTLTVTDNEGLSHSDTTIATVFGLDDTVGPLVTHTEIADGQPLGVAVVINATIQDPAGVEVAVLNYRPIGATGAAAFVTMTSLGSNQWSATIPSGGVTAAGVEYWIDAVDGWDPDMNPGTDDRNFSRTPATAPDGDVWDFLVTGDPNPPVIVHTEIADGQTNGEAVTVSATVTDATGVGSVQLYFRVTGGATFGAVPMTNISGNLWSAQIPAFVVVEPGVQYYITAVDTSPVPNTARAPVGAPATLYDFVVGSGDTTLPLIAHTPVPDGQPSGTPVVITAGVADAGGVASVSVFYRAAGSAGAFASVALASTGGTNWSGAIPGGSVNAPGVEYYVQAADVAGNIARDPSGAPTTFHSFTVTATDSAAPVITHTPITDGQPVSTSVLISAEITDASSVSSATLHYRAQGYPFFASVAMTNTSGNTWQASIPGFSVAAPGMEYYLRATDGASNVGVYPAGAPASYLSFAVGDSDTTPPTIAHSPIADNQEVGVDVSVSAVVFDTTGIGSVMLHYRTIGGGAFTGVAMTNTSGSTYAATIPGAAVTAAGVEYYLHAVDSSPDMNETFEPASAPTAGHTFTTTVPDITAPSITHTPVTSVTYGNDLVLTYTALDASGVASSTLYWALDGGGFATIAATPTGGGNYSVTVPAASITNGTVAVRYYLRVEDTAGNVATSPVAGATAPHSVTVNYPDTTPPVLTHTPVTTHVYGSDFTVNATATDDTALQGVTLYWALDGGSFVSQAMIPTGGNGYRTTVASSLITAGTVSIRYYMVAADAAGNTVSSPVAGSGAPNVVTVEYPDVVGPVVSLTPPGTQTVGVGFSVTITATDADSGVANVSLFYRASGAAGFTEVSATGTGPYSAAVPGAAVVVPSIELYAEAVDAAGNATQTTPITVTVEVPADAVPPTIDLAEVPDNQPAGAAVTVTADVTDASGVDSVSLWYRAVGGAWTELAMVVDAGVTYSADIPAGAVTVAGVEYYVVAVDSAPLANTATEPAGAPGAPASFTVTPTDTAGPTITHSPVAGPLLTGESLFVSATISDSSGVASATLSWRNSGGGFSDIAMTNTTGSLWTATVPSVTAPIVEYTITATDSVGNSGAAPAGAPTVVFSVVVNAPNTAAPLITHTPISTRYEPGTAVVFTATITDADGIAGARLLYRTSGDTTFRSLDMTAGAGDTWAVTLGGAAVAQPGVEYYIEATDGASVPRTSTDPATAPADVHGFDVGFGPVDSVAPVIAHTPPTGPVNAGTEIVVNATITDDSGVASAVLQLRRSGDVAWLSVPMTNTGGNAWQGTIPTLAVASPGVEYYLVATDASAASNLATSPAGAPAIFHTVVVVTPDTTAPTISLDTIPSPQLEGVAVTVAATITDAVGVTTATMYYSPPGPASFSPVAMSRAGDRWTAAIPAGAVQVGNVAYYVEAADAAGNTARMPATAPGGAATFRVDATVTPDTTPPVVTHTPSTTAIDEGATFAPSATVTDASGVLSVTLYVRTAGDAAWLTAAATPSGDVWTASVPSVLVRAPGLEYYFVAVDRASTPNSATSPAGAPAAFHSQPVTVVDATGPTIVLEAVPSPQTEATPVLFGADVTDPSGVGAVTLSFRIDGGAWETLVMTAAGGSTWATTLPAERVVVGTFDYYVDATDLLANSSSAPTGGAASPATFDVVPAVGPDIEPPSMLHTPIDAVIRGDNISITAVVTDASGVALVQVYARELGDTTFSSLDLVAGADDQYSIEVSTGLFAGDAVEYYLSATDGSAAVNTGTLPAGAPDDLYVVVIEDAAGDTGTDAGDAGVPDAGDAGTPDTGTDAGTDGGSDGGTDGGSDTGSDGGSDSGADAQTDSAGPDLGNFDVSLDGGGDTGSDVESATDGNGGKGGCSAAPVSPGAGAWLALVGIALVVRRRRIAR